VDDRSFTRFGGLAAMLLALTSWGAVLAYGTLVQPAADTELTQASDPRIGLQIVQFLYALIAFWSLFPIVAVYYRVRPVGEAWSFFATLIGVAAAVGAMVAAMNDVVGLRQTPPVTSVSASNPLSVLSFGRTSAPRALAVLGLVTAAVLFWGFLSGLSENGGVVYLAALFAGALGGPIYWLWLGRQLRRDA
jgi:hypothetical protein